MQFYNKYTKARRTYSSTAEVQKKMRRSHSAETSRPSTSLSENLSIENISSPKSLSEQPIEELPPLDMTPSCSSKGKRKTQAEEKCLLGVIETAKQISLAIQNPAAKNTNKSFSEYVYFRLQEMSEEETREKRRQILLTLETIE